VNLPVNSLNTAEKPESQDICFVPSSGYKKFIEDRVGAQAMTPGPFVDENGKVIGQHKVWRIIPSASAINWDWPWAIRFMFTKWTVRPILSISGNLRKLYSGGLKASGMNWVSMEIPQETIEVAPESVIILLKSKRI
jgi:tRNA U34 2-thiouridine synthase MnmA/TrmU